MSKTAMAALAGAYLNEDWPFEYRSWQAAVDDFVADRPDEARTLLLEIQQMLDDHDETQLEALMWELGMAYAPRPEDAGYRGWLVQVSARVESDLAARQR